MQRRVHRLAAWGAALGLGLIAVSAPPAAASSLAFGATLTTSTQPQGAMSCSDQIPDSVPPGGICTWVAGVAFENGSNFTAPKNGTLHSLKLVSCDGGKFKLQLVKKNSKGRFELVKSGPKIHYAADPRGDENCGGPDGNDYLIQSFPINVPVQKGEYIAIRAANNGLLHCSGDDMPLYYPALASGQGFRSQTGGTGCALLVRLGY